MTIGVGTRTNSLIVGAPRALFQEVKQLVEELDLAAGDQDQAMRVVPLHRVTPEAVQQVLSAAAGELAEFGTRTPSSALGTSTAPRQQVSPSPLVTPRLGGGQTQLGQGAGVTPGQSPRTQPSRAPYYRGRSAAPTPVPVQ